MQYTHLQHIEPVRVTEVPATDFSAHVPTVEGVRGEFYTAAIETHVRDRWQSVPAQFQLFEPIVTANNYFINLTLSIIFFALKLRKGQVKYLFDAIT